MSYVHFKWKGQELVIDKMLAEALMSLVWNIKHDWDFVVIISGNRMVRVGKTQVKGSKVLMADGEWKNVEDVKKGDMVISVDVLKNTSSFATVKETHSYFCENTFDVCKKHTGEVLYTCSDNHDIPYHQITPKGNKHLFKISEAKELYKKTDGWFRTNSITTNQGAFISHFSNKNSSIKPYSLGVFLGDGSIHKGAYKRLCINCSSAEVMEKVKSEYNFISVAKQGDNCNQYNFSIYDKFYNELVRVGLDNKISGDKFIPKECLYSDYRYRLELLAGLVDTDGYIDKRGIITYTTKSKKLAEDIQELCRSLGGNCNIKPIRKEIKGRGFVGQYYTLSINLGERQTDIPIVRKFKRDRIKPITQPKNKVHIKLKKNKPQMVYGFEIDSPTKLYITDNYTVTHNSVLGLTVSAFLAYLLEKKGLNKDAFALDHIIFDHEKLVEIAREKPPYSIFQYDEAREGLVAQKAASEMQGAMLDFFNECGQLNDIFVLVLPDFYVLREEMAVGRSEFLINVYRKSHVIYHDMMGDGVKHPVVSFDRGFFKFYNRESKNLMFDLFRTTRIKSYSKVKESFPAGQFENQYPVPKEEYSKLKLEALKRFDKKKEEKEKEKEKPKISILKERANAERDRVIEVLKRETGWTDANLAKNIKMSFSKIRVSRLRARADRFEEETTTPKETTKEIESI